MCRSAVMLVLLATSITTAMAQEPRAWPTEFRYVAKLGGAEIGSEEVVLDGASWRTTGRFDILGTRKGSYVAERTAGAERDFAYRIVHALPTGEVPVESKRVGADYTVRLPSRDQEKTIEIDAEAAYFVFDNLVWACFLDVGRELQRLEARGELTPDHKLLGVAGSGAVAFELIVHETVRSTQSVHGEMKALRISKFLLPPAVEVTMVWNEAGLPLRFDIPSQHIVVQIEGYEEIASERIEAKSIVDSGEWRKKLSPAVHKVIVERGVEIAMRDGVKLKADLYRPEGTERYPAILARTPYNRISEGALKGHDYAARGYVFVAEDVRGRFESEGEWLPFVNEERDGHDTLTWIAKQPWCTGDIGMIGASYVGLVQWLVAQTGHPALKCIVPQVSPPDPDQNFPYEGGCFMLLAAWWSRVLEAMENQSDWASGLDWEAMYRTLPLSALDDALGLEGKSFLDEWLAHPPHDMAYWGPMAYQGKCAEMSVPAFHVSGWWDGDMPGAIQNFPLMRAKAKTERARKGQYLVLGPWTHIFNTQRKLGDVDYGDEAVIDLDACYLRFFDHYLKRIDNGIENDPPVYVFAMGANRWRAASNWPLPETELTKLFLTGTGDCLKRDGGGRLQLEPPAADAQSVSFRYDPMNLPSLDGVDWGDLSGKMTTADRSGDEDREDELDFISPPLTRACEVIGPVEAVLWVASDAKDTDVAVTLWRVTQRGERYAIRGGVQRLRYAKDPRRDQPVPPGELVEVHVDCWATGLVFEATDRIALTVDSIVWPGYGRNLNTLESPLTAKEGVVATNTIHLDAAHASYVLLPVIPAPDGSGLEFSK